MVFHGSGLSEAPGYSGASKRRPSPVRGALASSGKPFEAVSYTNSSGVAQSLAVVIPRFSGTATPRLKIVFPRTAGISNVQFATPNAAGDTVGATIFGHNAAASEIV